MSQYNFTATYDSSTRANMVTWAQTFSTFLTSVGEFALTGDTGQINFSTAALSGGNPNSWGYQVFKFTDTLQTSAAFFMRVDYWCNNWAIDNGSAPSLGFRFSTSTDGGGNPTGNVSPQYYLGTFTGSTTAVAQNCVLAGGLYSGTSSGDSNWFAGVMWDGSSFQDPWYFSVERTVDVAGNPNTDGLIVHMAASGGGVTSFVLPSALSGNTPLAPQTALCVPLNYKQASMAGSGVVGVAYPIPYNGRPYNYGIGCAVYQGADFGPQTSSGFSVYGATHNYRVPTTVSPAALTPVSSALARLMLRYE
jgi:hypothetical protein